MTRPLDRDDVRALRLAAADLDHAADDLMARCVDAASRRLERATRVVEALRRGERWPEGRER